MEWRETDLPKLRTIAPYELLVGNEHLQKRRQYRNPEMFLPGPVQDDLLPVRPIDAIRGGNQAYYRDEYARGRDIRTPR